MITYLPEQIDSIAAACGGEFCVESDAERFIDDLRFCEYADAPLVRTPQSPATPHLTALKTLAEHQTHLP